jgi:DNA-binding beta-propeller fold protein YncE
MGGLNIKRSTGTVATAVAASLLLATSALAALGDLTQKAGTAACISETGTAGLCLDGNGLDRAISLVVSPDGKNAYVASFTSDAVVVLDRNPSTGALTQKAGTAGCISDTGTAGTCVDGNALDGATSVAISPDGTSVYVVAFGSGAAGTGALVVFDREPATGTLTQKPGPAGCFNDLGAAPCTDGNAISVPGAVVVAPGGTDVYLAATGSDSVAAFTRAPSGSLTQKAGTAGCLTPSGAGGCGALHDVNSPRDITISPNGANVYMAADVSDTITVFDRDPATGALTQKAGTAGCAGQGPGSVTCSPGRGLIGASSVVISADGRNLYSAAASGPGGTSNAVATFDRNTSTGALTQKPGTTGCISDNGADNSVPGRCTDGTALDGTFDVALSPGGETAYVGSAVSNAVTVFTRDTMTGALTQRSGTSACVSETGSGGACADGVALDEAGDIAIPVSGTNVYVTGMTSDAVAVFDRATLGGGGGGDITPPKLTITKQPKKKLATTKTKKKVKVKFVSEPGARFTCKIDKKPAKACSSPLKALLKASTAKRGKKHTIVIVAIDTAGNSSAPAIVKTRVVRKL